MSNFNPRGPQSRAGVIPFVIEDRKIYLGLGISAIGETYTDFGGGVCDTIDRDTIDAAYREWKEESLSVFESYSICPSFVAFTKRSVIVFVFIDANKDSITSMFNDRLKEEQCPELTSIEWIEYSKFIDLMMNSGHKVNWKLKKILLPSHL